MRAHPRPQCVWPPSARERNGLCRPQLPWLAFRRFDRERDVCGPPLEPVPGVEFGIAPEIEVSVPVRDGKEEPDLRPNAGNSGSEFAERRRGAAVARQLVVDIADSADV